MSRFQLYKEVIDDSVPERRDDLISALRQWRSGSSLARLEAAREALLRLKEQLSRGESSDPAATIRQAIRQLEATS